MSKKIILTILLVCLPFWFGTSANPETEPHVKIMEMEGSVRLQRNIPWWQFWNFSSLDQDDVLMEGDRVQTLGRSTLFLEFPGGSLVWVEPNSLFEIREVGEEKNSLYMSRGSLGARIIRIIEGVITFEVETPSAVAAVRGTEFFLVVERGKTTLSVSQGQVVLIAQGVEVIVGPGETVEAYRGKAPGVRPSDSEEGAMELTSDSSSEKHSGMPDRIREKLRGTIPDKFHDD